MAEVLDALDDIRATLDIVLLAVTNGHNAEAEFDALDAMMSAARTAYDEAVDRESNAADDAWLDSLRAAGWTDGEAARLSESGLSMVEGVLSPCGRWSVALDTLRLTHQPSGLAASWGRPTAEQLAELSERFGPVSDAERTNPQGWAEDRRGVLAALRDGAA